MGQTEVTILLYVLHLCPSTVVSIHRSPYKPHEHNHAEPKLKDSQCNLTLLDIHNVHSHSRTSYARGNGRQVRQRKKQFHLRQLKYLHFPRSKTQDPGLRALLGVSEKSRTLKLSLVNFAGNLSLILPLKPLSRNVW